MHPISLRPLNPGRASDVAETVEQLARRATEHQLARMNDSPDRARQALLDALPDGAMLETTLQDTGRGLRATARIEAPWDSVKPCYLARAATEDEALLRALDHCAHYWVHRSR